MRYFLIIASLLACCLSAHSQTYPVQVNTQIVPPYSPYLADYTAPGAQRLMVNILLKDITLPEYSAKLRITLEGVGITIRTKPSYIPPPLILPGGGIPLLLYGEDIAEYFDPAHLDFSGITRSQYEKGAKLPEGVYRFTIEVLDYNRGTPVSNKGTTVAWIILNDPPLLNFPRRETKVQFLDPTNIAFSWTPRHSASPNSAFTTEYIFKLVEIWPANRNPFDAMLTLPPLYEITTNFSQIVYGPAEPALIPGRKYAWQVQARDEEGRDLFKNQGKSEVFVFQFGDPLGVPEDLRLQTATPSALTLRWDQPVAGSEAITYRIRYRPAGNPDGPWYEDTTEELWRTITSLQPDKDYQVQIRAEQNIQLTDYSAPKIFKTKVAGENDFACSSDIQPPPQPNSTQPLFKLGINDTIRAGGYDVVVKKVSGSNGIYTGEGLAIVPWFMSAKVKVTFDKIGVNEQYWLTSGTIKSVWDANSKFLLKPETKPGNQVTPDLGENSVNIAETETLIEIKTGLIVSVTKNEDGEVVVETSSGETQVVPKGASASIVDSAGNGYVVDKEGNIAKTTAEAAREAYNKGQREYNLELRFAKGSGKFGFDEKKFDALAAYYQHLNDESYIPWKAVSSFRADGVDAILEGANINAEKIRFEVDGSVVTPQTNSDNKLTFSLIGKTEGTEEEFIAYYQDSDTATQKVIGKLNLVSYDKITKNVVIVPVNMDLPSGLSAPIVKSGLEEIYEQAVAYWQVNAANRINVTFDQPFDDGGSGLLSNYTNDMKKVIAAYGSLQDETYYLFLISNNTASGNDALGYMPRSKQAGFIFTTNHGNNTSKIIRTMAHELGHGVFNLKHTFSEFPGLATKGITLDNLMDYPNGSKLYKYQWDHLHDPQRVIPLFEDDEEGESYGPNTGIPDLWRNSDKTVHFITPNKKIIRLPKETLRAYFSFGTGDFKNQPLLPSGVLTVFTVVEGKDTVKYQAAFSGNRFLGYKNLQGKYVSVLPKQNNTEADAAIIHLPYSAGFKVYRLKGLPYPYMTSGQTDENFIDLTNTASANLNATSWQELSAFPFSEGKVEFGVSSAHINPDYTGLLNNIDPSAFNQQYLLVCKIMEFRTVYPDLYDRMTVSFNNWTTVNVWNATLFNDVLNLTPENAALVLLNKEKANITAGYFDYLCRKNEWYNSKSKEELLVLFLQEFQNLINYYLKKNDSKIQVLKSTFSMLCEHGEEYIIANELSPDDIVNVVGTMSVDDLKMLCPKVRSRLVSIVLERFVVSDPYEKCIYKLLWTCPEGSGRALLLETLAETKDSDQDYILGTLVSAVDDETLFMGEDYNTMIMNFIIRAYGSVISSNSEFTLKSIKPITDLDLNDMGSLTEKQLESLTNVIVTYNYQGFTKRLFKEVLKSLCPLCMLASGDFQYDTKSVTSFNEKTNQVSYSNKTVSGFVTIKSTTEVQYHPLAPIILDDKAKLLDIYSTSGGYYVPAVMLYFLEKKADAKTTVDAVQTTFDIASLAIPGGQATLALKLLNYADKISAVSSLVGSYAETDYPAFAKFMNLTSGVLGVANLTGNFAYSKISKLNSMKSSMELMDKSEDIISAAGHENKLTGLCDKIDQMNDPSKLDPDLADILNSTGKEKQTLIDVLELEKSAATAAGKSNLATRVEAAITKLRTAANGIKIVKSARLQNLFEVMSKRFGFLAKDGDKIYGNAAKSTQLAHVENGEIVLDQISDIKNLGENARLEETITDAFYLEQKSGQLAEHTDDILIFYDNGTIKCLTGANCFTGNTLVMARSGLTTIQQIKSGDEVLSYNEQQKTSGWNKVTQLFNKTVGKLNRLIIGSDTLFTTPEHKFLTAKGWLKAAMLSTGVMLQTTYGYAALSSNESIDSTVTVYNFTVAQNHTYHVGKQQIITHNDCEDLADIIRQLGDKGQDFLNDFKNNQSLLDKFISGEYIANAWLLINKMDPSLSKTEDWIKSLSNLTKNDPAVLDDLADPVLFDAWKNVRNNPENAWKVYDVFKEAGKLSDNFKNYIKSKYFNDIMQKGKDFEDFVRATLNNPGSSIWKSLNLDPSEYRIFEQVQLKTGNLVDQNGKIFKAGENIPAGTITRDEYFVADFVLVKMEEIPGGGVSLDFENAIILETKLSFATDLTERQLNAVANITAGNNSFSVRGSALDGSSSKLQAIDFIKVYSNGVGGVVSGVKSLK